MEGGNPDRRQGRKGLEDDLVLLKYPVRIKLPGKGTTCPGRNNILKDPPLSAEGIRF
jgi:hypothetical protein